MIEAGNPESYFDALSLVTAVKHTMDGAGKAEVYLLAYLAALLALYRGESIADWGYTFAVTGEGYPYAAALASSLDDLERNGLVLDDGEGFYDPTSVGENELKRLQEHRLLSRRTPFLQGATGSVLTLPVGAIKIALSNEPDIRAARELSQTRLLPSQTGQVVLYEQFEELSRAVGVDTADLMVPAVVWLTYLSQPARGLGEGI